MTTTTDIWDGRPYSVTKSLIALSERWHQRAYSDIINDREYFWQIFCLAMNSSSHQFKVTLFGDNLIIEGDPTCVKELYDGVEEIRQLFESALKTQKDFKLIPRACCENQYLMQMQIDVSNSLIPQDWKKHHLISQSSYESFVQPNIKTLCAFLQLSYKSEDGMKIQWPTNEI